MAVCQDSECHKPKCIFQALKRVHFEALETKRKHLQCDFGFRDGIELQICAFSRPWEMHLGLAGGFESWLTASGVEPRPSAELKAGLNAFLQASQNAC